MTTYGVIIDVMKPNILYFHRGSLWYIHKTITLNHNIINPVIITNLLIIRVYENFQINCLKKTNTTRTQNIYFLHKKFWNSGTKPAYVEPPPIP